MTAPLVTRTFSIGRLLLGVLLAFATHALVVAGAFLAGRLVEPSPGGGYDDVAAVVSILVIGEIAIFVGAAIAVVVMLVKRRYDWALGLFLGWLAGPIGAGIVALSQADSIN